MMKKASAAALAAFGLLAGSALPVLAEGTAAPTAATTNTKQIDMQCVGAAVAKREAALGSAASTMATAMSAVYTARAAALATAYTGSDSKSVRSAVKIAWSNFTSGAKSAKSASKSAREAALKQFKTEVKACKGGSSVSDTENASGEMSV